MQCNDVIAQWWFCTLLSVVSAKYSGELFETAVCNSKQQRNAPLAFPGSSQPPLINAFLTQLSLRFCFIVIEQIFIRTWEGLIQF